MREKLNIQLWNRREHFEFFKGFAEPFWGATVNVPVTKAYNNCKAHGISFYNTYTHALLRAINSVENLRYRLESDEVWVYNAIHASGTMGRPDGTFAFTFLEYTPDFTEFEANVMREKAAVLSSTGLRFNPDAQRTDVVHYSPIPWLQFTSLSHARHFSFPDSVPKISVGKIFYTENEVFMPVSLHVHHALADGIHGGAFFNELAAILSENH